MNVQIAQRLAELRRAKGYSQEALAHELGLSRQAVSKWERAESSPDTENLIALARLYGVSLDDLLNVDADIVDDIAFEKAERARADAEEAERKRADDEEATRRQEDRERAVAQAAAAATRASEAAARAADAAVSASAHVAMGERDAVPAPEGPRRRGPWRSFPYSIFVTILFFVFGFVLRSWTTAWLVFLTIPIYRWIAGILDDAIESGKRPGPADGSAGPTAIAGDTGDADDAEGRRRP